MRRGTSYPALAVVLFLLLVAGIGLRWLVNARTEPAPVVAAARTPARVVPTIAWSPGLAARELAAENAGPAEGVPHEDELGGFDNSPDAWESVDMEAIRAALPDNTYWKMAVPTKDPAVLAEREKERQRWNVEYGKVLSNTATDEEIDAYYAERQRLSED